MLTTARLMSRPDTQGVQHLLARLETFICEPSVTDVLVSTELGAWVDRGQGLEREASISVDERVVREAAVHLINLGNRHIDEAHPCTDARLPSGLRVHAVLAGVSVRGTTISIRVPAKHQFTLDSLKGANMLAPEHVELLKVAVSSRKNVLICGGSGAGKTTLLNALLSEVPDHERLVIVEDVAELRPTHPQTVNLEVRQANVDGYGSLDCAELVRHSLRMRADRLAVGEIRGDEIVPFLSALNTGHSGAGTTLHATSIDRVAARLESLGLLAGISMSAIGTLAAQAIDLVVQLDKSSGTRKLVALGTFTCNTAGRLELSPL